MVARTSSTEPLDLFFSYSHRDEELRAELETHLASLKREGAIRTWHDREISAGLEWAGEIDQHLQEADLILLLISPDFMASDYCFDREMGRALERHEAAEARVIPIIARPTDWRTSGFARLQALPKDGKPITRWPDRDEAFLYVVRGLRRVIEEMQKSRKDSVEAARGRARASEEGVLAAADSGLEDRPDAEELRRLDQQRRPQPRRPLTGPLPSDLRRPLTSLPEQDDFDLDDSRWLAFDPDDRELVKQVLDLEETLQARQRKEDMAALLRKEALERGIKISEPRIDRLGREPYCVDGPFLVRAGTCGSAYPGVRRRGSRRRRRFRAFPRCRTATAAAHPDSRVRSSRSHLSARARVLRRLSLRCRGCPQKWATRVAIRDACSPNACARSRF
ncbi:MAG: toll/interleukin-1 receptor domain-containing protein [bacterium]|nr:toll/interleukin-1 receptor domain-containing protein [bacterium]